jgi:hypothetical protein
VWDTGTGAFLCALETPTRPLDMVTFLIYQQPLSRIVASLGGGRLCTWEGDDFGLLLETRHTLAVAP